MSFHIPGTNCISRFFNFPGILLSCITQPCPSMFLALGFRRTYPWFPSEVYYTVPTKQFQEYTVKHLEKDLLFAVPLRNPELAKPEDPAKNDNISSVIPDLNPNPESKKFSAVQVSGGGDAVFPVDPSSCALEEGGAQADVTVKGANLKMAPTTDKISAKTEENTLSLGPSIALSRQSAGPDLLTQDATST